MITQKSIDDLINQIMQKIAQAAAKSDIQTVTALTRCANELKELQLPLLRILEKLKEIEKPTEKTSASQTLHLRELPVEVTAGMIRQNLLTLTEAVKQGKIRPAEDMIIETLPNGERFRTDLLQNGNRLRERGAIGRFYREATVKPGDYVVLNEVSAQKWTLQKAAPGKFQIDIRTLY